MKKKVAVFIDGGFLRANTNKLNNKNKNKNLPQILYDHKLIIKAANNAIDSNNEELFRIHYFDCDPYSGELTLPISKNKKTVSNPSTLLSILSCQEKVCVRKGVLKFRGWTLKKNKSTDPTVQLKDDDFKEKYIQKGVDIRIGLDLVNASDIKICESVILLTNDTDLVPAMKIARTRGMNIGCVSINQSIIARELKSHSDFFRNVNLQNEKIS